ncbi:hypothetical protein TNCV_3110521 [Trichonephila clavipes]|nr:hypothetical protein TNCV_3110521 [Trichonephila clavipes]
MGLFRGAIDPNFIFMDDNARPHRTLAVKGAAGNTLTSSGEHPTIQTDADLRMGTPTARNVVPAGSDLFRCFILVAATAENFHLHIRGVGNGNSDLRAVVAISVYSSMTLIQNARTVVASNVHRSLQKNATPWSNHQN